MHVKIKSRREKPEGFRKEGKNKQIVQLINVKILWKFNLLSCVFGIAASDEDLDTIRTTLKKKGIEFEDISEDDDVRFRMIHYQMCIRDRHSGKDCSLKGSAFR